MDSKYYDKVSEIYDLVRSGDPQIVEFILSMKPVDVDSRVLEIGCGSGNNTVLMKAVTGAEVYGMDQSEGMLEKAKMKDESIHFSLGDAVLLEGFPDNSFDVVYMVDVIHHINNIDAMFRNIYRVLKKDGMVFIFGDTQERIRNERITSKYFPETVEPELKRYQPTQMILSSMEGCGFESVSLENAGNGGSVDFGEQLIELAEKKGYSMFHLISEEAIQKGIERLREDMKNGPITYCQNGPVFTAVKAR